MSQALSVLDNIFPDLSDDKKECKSNEKVKATVWYWNGRGLAEPIRFLLAACNAEIENKFITKKK